MLVAVRLVEAQFCPKHKAEDRSRGKDLRRCVENKTIQIRGHAKILLFYITISNAGVVSS